MSTPSMSGDAVDGSSTDIAKFRVRGVISGSGKRCRRQFLAKAAVRRNDWRWLFLTLNRQLKLMRLSGLKAKAQAQWTATSATVAFVLHGVRPGAELCPKPLKHCN